MPQPFLLHVNSRPQPGSGVDDDLWVKWYTEEHVPDLVNSKASVRAAMYREITGSKLAPQDEGARPFLVLYQTDHEEPLKSKEYVDSVRHTSDLWPGDRKENSANGDFDARNYKLIQDYDPDGRGEQPSPSIVTVEMEPVDEVDFEKWYREEHLDMLHEIPGYRRTSRYVLGPRTPLTLGEPSKYLAIHELDSLSGLEGKEADAANKTPWTVKHIQDSKFFGVRRWELVYSKGY